MAQGSLGESGSELGGVCVCVTEPNCCNQGTRDVCRRCFVHKADLHHCTGPHHHTTLHPSCPRVIPFKLDFGMKWTVSTLQSK